MRRIQIRSGDILATAVLSDNATAQAIWDALPLEAQANTWGDEIYFGIPVHVDQAKDASDVLSIGDLGYWPPGNAFCIFFGRTPASRGDEIRAASSVNVFGKVEGDAKVFKRVSNGASITIDKAGE